MSSFVSVIVVGRRRSIVFVVGGGMGVRRWGGVRRDGEGRGGEGGAKALVGVSTQVYLRYSRYSL